MVSVPSLPPFPFLSPCLPCPLLSLLPYRTTPNQRRGGVHLVRVPPLPVALSQVGPRQDVHPTSPGRTWTECTFFPPWAKPVCTLPSPGQDLDRMHPCPTVNRITHKTESIKLPPHYVTWWVTRSKILGLFIIEFNYLHCWNKGNGIRKQCSDTQPVQHKCRVNSPIHPDQRDSAQRYVYSSRN